MAVCRVEKTKDYTTMSNFHLRDPKFDITKHPNYKYLSDADPRNNFDIEKYLSTQLKTKPDEVYQVFEVDASDVSETA